MTWRQGALLPKELFNSTISSLPSALPQTGEQLVVLSHSCDLARPDKEPWVELLTLASIDKIDGSLAKLRSYRTLHFGDNRGNFKVEAWRKSYLERRLLAGHAPDGFLEKSTTDLIVRWVTGRLQRNALPDRFCALLQPKKDELKELLRDCHQTVEKLFISLDPFRDLLEGECYEVDVIFVPEEAVLINLSQTVEVDQCAAMMQEVLTEPPYIECKCHVMNSDSVSLRTLRDYIEWNAFDTLSE